MIDEPDRRRVVVLVITAWRKVRTPQGMMPGNPREEDREVFRQIAQQKVYRPATGKGEMAG